MIHRATGTAVESRLKICAFLHTAELRSSTRTAGSNPTEGERADYKSTVPQKF